MMFREPPDRMKNILILDTGKEWGGGTNSLLELLKRIDRVKYNLTALFYHNCDHPVKGGTDIKTEIKKLGVDFLLLDRRGQPLTSKILKELVRVLLFFNTRVRKLLVFRIDYLFRIRDDSKKITEILKERNITLLYMNNQPSSNLEGIIAARNAGIMSLVHSRIEADLNPFEVNAVNNWLTKMVCVSEGVKRSFIEQGINGSKCSVVHNGIDVELKALSPADGIRREFGIKKEEVLIGAVGSLMKRKRFNDLIKAVAYLRDSKGLGNIKCLIIGEGPERASLQKEIEREHLSDRIILAGFRSDAISYINALDIFILPSEREGFPRVILEAMLMEKPVIACDIAGPSEVVIDGETGFLVPSGDIKRLAGAVFNLITSDTLRKDMGKKSRQDVVEKYTIDHYVSGVEKVLEEVFA